MSSQWFACHVCGKYKQCGDICRPPPRPLLQICGSCRRAELKKEVSQ